MNMQRSRGLVRSSNFHCTPRQASKKYAKPLVKLVKKLTLLKSQEKFLEDCGKLDIFTSIRPRVGKTFDEANLQNELNKVIEEARLKIVDLGKREKGLEIKEVRGKLNKMYEEIQELPASDFRNLHEKARKAEERLQCTISKTHERKVNVFVSRNTEYSSTDFSTPSVESEPYRRHRRSQRYIKRRYNKRKKIRKKRKKHLDIEKEIQNIKESNLVKNFSTEDIPDEVYLYLALGSQFCPISSPRMHDYIYDTKAFCRKLAWSAYHESRKKEADDKDESFDILESSENEEGEDPEFSWGCPRKLKIKSRQLPDYNDNLLSHVTEKLKNGISAIIPPEKKKQNLTMLEAKGQRWCKEAVKNKRLYITKADKGGGILILDAEEVDTIMKNTLEEKDIFKKLPDDPRDDTKKSIKKMVKDFQEKNLLTAEEVFAISGQTKKGGMARGHEFVVGKPYMYPLFKLHKLSQDEILMKKIPPTRMVTSGVGGPTYRLGVFLDMILKPVIQQYCKNELIRDSTDFLKELQKMEEDGKTTKMNFIGTLDVDALYPNIRKHIALDAVSDALETVTAFSRDQIQMIIEMARFCIENSVVHYRGQWYKLLVGIPTGGPESGGIANACVFYVLEKILLIDERIKQLNKMLCRKRFLDDLFFGWEGTKRQFAKFKAILNEVGSRHGMTFKGAVDRSVDFLDTTVSLQDDCTLTTKMFVKPTDATRYLHRRSDHSPHTFKSMPFSQFRRAVVLCTNQDDKIQCINYIANKLLNSGFKDTEIENAREKALKLDRQAILSAERGLQTNGNDKTLTFMINRNGYMCKEIKKVVRECNPDINKLLESKVRIIIAERKNSSIASTVFAKSSFSRIDVPFKETQKCESGHGCKICRIMNLNKNVTLWKNNAAYERTIKLDFRCNCVTECVIYLYVCNLCKDNESFYVGQTQNSAQQRANGHRGKFNPITYKKSALSYHIHQDHPQYTTRKLRNYSLGIIKQTSAANLDKDEDYYNELLHAKLSLNRYKVTA